MIFVTVDSSRWVVCKDTIFKEKEPTEILKIICLLIVKNG